MMRLVVGMFIGAGMMELGLWAMMTRFYPVFGIPIIGMILLCAGATTMMTVIVK